MLVTFVSQCEKKALLRTRRVLDAFANRIGDRTWQTVITQEGLAAVKKLLRQSASKNTAVACHWMRGTRRSDLVWIIGRRESFAATGAVPVNTTRRHQPHHDKESDWHYLPLIKGLSALAALFHDWGKASALFQDKLDPSKKTSFKGDPLRHEWISCLLLQAFVQAGKDEDAEQTDDTNWLIRLAQGEIDETCLQTAVVANTINPLAGLPPVASLVAWLVLTHHRLPLERDKEQWKKWRNEPAPTIPKMLRRIGKEWGYENRYDEAEYQARIEQCFCFPKGLLSQSIPWLKLLKKWATRLHKCLPLLEQARQTGSERLLLHHARLALMLGDHDYSSQDAATNWQGLKTLHANTDNKTKQLRQTLDEHLTGVAHSALNIAHQLPRFEQALPRVHDLNALKRKSPADFRWQDKAVEKIKGEYQRQRMTTQSPARGFFAVNMASTGRGKTFANAKIMRALSDDGDSLRYVLALGLRTLTLQTGDEYRERIGLDNSELAVLIGSKAILDLHRQARERDEEPTHYEQSGSESQQSLLDEEVDYEGELPEEGLTTVLKTERDRKFLYAPVLVCTIDHLMAATETVRGGRYILPSLRLMSSDLVIDEVDDFDSSDLIAIGRLIHLAGMLGRKVMISSATIPPALAEGYFHAYREGWRLYCQTREASGSVGCSWIDEFSTRVENITETWAPEARISYRDHHQHFIDRRVAKLKGQPVRRRGEIIPCDHLLNTSESVAETNESRQQCYFSVIQKAILEKHPHHHTVDEPTQKTVSFGVVRVAHIDTCIALAQYLMQANWPEDIDAKILAYHSRQVLLLRHAEEAHLDAVLKRKEKNGEPPLAFSDPVIRGHLETSTARRVLFILVATPVEEIGRDHDFDWAVIEPSSFRSIIQLAGRVMRHREIAITVPNIALMQYNLHALQKDLDKAAYCRPGYEGGQYLLGTHNLSTLLEDTDFDRAITAIPRIQPSKRLDEKYRLADLEHAVLRDLLGESRDQGPESPGGWQQAYWWLTALPQALTPFRAGPPETKLSLLWEEDRLCFKHYEARNKEWIPQERIYSISHAPFDKALTPRCWLARDYKQLLDDLAERDHLSQSKASKRYGELRIPERRSVSTHYEYTDQFGLRKA